jgi:hypothetical protein
LQSCPCSHRCMEAGDTAGFFIWRHALPGLEPAQSLRRPHSIAGSCPEPAGRKSWCAVTLHFSPHLATSRHCRHGHWYGASTGQELWPDVHASGALDAGHSRTWAAQHSSGNRVQTMNQHGCPAPAARYLESLRAKSLQTRREKCIRPSHAFVGLRGGNVPGLSSISRNIG